MQLVQSILPIDIVARDLLLSPGGLWSVIIEKWVQHYDTKCDGGWSDANVVMDVRRYICDV